jgi:hypothetical protein
MNSDLKTSPVAVPVLVRVLIVKVVIGYWVQIDLNLCMGNQNIVLLRQFGSKILK